MSKNGAEVTLSANTEGYKEALDDAKKQSKDLGNQVEKDSKKSQSAFRKLGNYLKKEFATPWKTITAGVLGFIAASIKSAAGLEKMRVKFTTLTGSAQAANKHIEELRDFATKTPFQLDQLADSSAVLQSFGTDVGDVQGRLREIGDVAAATGQPIKDLAIIYGQVGAAGKLTGERLLQLQERGVPILSALAEKMNTTKGAVREMITAGKISNDTFQDVFSTLSMEGGMAFGGMEAQSQTFEGKLSTLKDEFANLGVTIGNVFLPEGKSFLTWLTEVTKGTSEFVEEGPGWFGSMIDGWVNKIRKVTGQVPEEMPQMSIIPGKEDEVDTRSIEEFELDLLAKENLLRQHHQRVAAEKAAAAADQRKKDIEQTKKDIKDAADADKEKRKAEREAEQKEIREKNAFNSTMRGMAQSQNTALAGIGKAWAIKDAIIKGEQAVQGAFTWGTSIGSPFLGKVLAAAAAAFSAEQVAKIAGVKLYEGGTVLPRGGRASAYRDSVPASLAVGETVISRDLTDKLGKMSEGGGNLQQIDQSISINVQGNVIADDDEQVDSFIERINDRVENYNARLTASGMSK